MDTRMEDINHEHPNIQRRLPGCHCAPIAGADRARHSPGLASSGLFGREIENPVIPFPDMPYIQGANNGHDLH